MLAEDAARDCIAPIPNPPIAPASKPNKINTGILSISFFALNFAMRYSPSSILAFTLPLPAMPWLRN